MIPLARPRLVLVLPLVWAAVSAGGLMGCSGGSGSQGSGGSSAGTGGSSAGTGGSSAGTGGTVMVGSGGMGGAASGGSGGAIADAKYVPCTSATRVGALSLTLVHAVAATGNASGTAAHAQFGGSIYDRVKPDTVWPMVDQAGNCRVLVGPTLSCSACASAEVCAGTNVCQPASKTQGAGVVTVSGLSTPLASTPTKTNLYYETFSSDVTYPPFTAGATINLMAAGDALPAFNLAVRAIAPLELPANQTLMLSDGKPLNIAWTAASASTAGRITISMDIGHHNGVTAAHLDCDFPDTGSATIPATLITTLLSKGFAGFPDMEIARVSVDSTTIAPGCVEWIITAPLKVPVQLEGVTSCHEDVDCPTATPVCHADLTCGT